MKTRILVGSMMAVLLVGCGVPEEEHLAAVAECEEEVARCASDEDAHVLVAGAHAVYPETGPGIAELIDELGKRLPEPSRER